MGQARGPAGEPLRDLVVHAGDLAALHGRAHPLEVSASRRHDWFRTTGMVGPWVIPDWSTVAQEADAVHLPAVAYLELAGRTPPLGDGRWTVIAGWDPDDGRWRRG